jgi:GMP synthase (glutamine-hydrolysing)
VVVLVVISGNAPAWLKALFGDMGEWVRSLLPRDVRVVTIDAYQGAHPSGFQGIDGIIVTGSPQSATNPGDWTRWWCEHLPAAGVPALGICYGMHLLALANGGRVGRGAAREIGTIEVELTAAGQADPLFAGMPSRIHLHGSHRDDVVELPSDAVVLATNRRGVQAARFGPVAYGIQCHPELTAESARVLLEVRAEEAASQAPGAEPLDASPIRPAPAGPRLLSNFVGIMRDFAVFGPGPSPDHLAPTGN